MMRADSFNPRMLFFGTTSETSFLVLSGLLAADISISGVFVWSETAGRAAVTQLAPDLKRSPLPLAEPFIRRSIIELAWNAGLPVFATNNLKAPALLKQVAEFQPDIACVACFPQRMPPQLLALPQQGFLNVHPSLLPAHRGPVPLFWTFQAGEIKTGVTVHWMDASFDTGPIALQATIELPDGISYQAADQQLWERGTALLIEALQARRAGTLARHAQPPQGTYEPWPQAEHFILSSQWSAQRAFNFMRGTSNWQQLFLLQLPEATLELAQARSYHSEETLGQPFVASSNELWIQFTPGVLHARGLIH